MPPGAAGNPATQVNASGTGAASAVNITLPAAVGKITYCTGIVVTGAGATAASNITVTITNVLNGPMSFKIVIPAGVNTSITPLVYNFNPPLQGLGLNTAINFNVPSFGAGNTDSAAMINGFQQ
jgi:hypothetical protein